MQFVPFNPHAHRWKLDKKGIHMDIETLKENLKRDLASRQHDLTREQIGKVVESVAIVESVSIETGADVGRLLKELPHLANDVVEEVERVTIIDAARYVYEAWIKQELSATADEFYIAQFGDDFSPNEYALALLKDAVKAMDDYWPTDKAGLGMLELRLQMDSLKEAEGIASKMAYDPKYAHPLLEKLAVVCKQSDAFRVEFSRKWELAKDVVDNAELFQIEKSLGYSR
jgi:hypothetical protein